MWESILRPAFESKASFSDIADDTPGALEIRYAKNRGILQDEEEFRPEDPLLLGDALLWLFRTRNVRELPEMTADDVPEMIGAYPIVEMNRTLDSRVTREELLSMINVLDGKLRTEVHEVSFYGDDFQGEGTAFGEKFDKNALTAAHRSYPSNTLVRVTNVETQQSVVVRINDRGPYVHGRDMDLSEAAFMNIAHPGKGVIRATFERLGDFEMSDPCEESAPEYQRRITRSVQFFRGVPHAFRNGKQLVLQANRPFVVLAIVFPDGQKLRVQDFVHPDEKYRFTPDSDGSYTFLFGDAFGREREMRMHVSSC
ncbi:septal ring lytic transglycosylase RlpA family protein [Candidatus Peregrinibacteria bacterium]|nr:septal ring lytic transglycosylase RlpA family protein [Candidatus Peregrinibacteria bacterium]